MIRHLFSVVAFVFAACGAPLAHAAAAPETFAPLVEKLTPAVVNVYTTQKIKTNPMMGLGMQLPDDPRLEPFRQFFEQFGGMQGGIPGMPMAPQEREVQSLGSGFIIDAAGYVVTNNHVIADADEVSIKLHDETELKAEIVGRDSKTDLALLKVKSAKPLPYVSFGNSDTARVGDWVVVIGNPFGLGGSVSAGIISARSRSINAGPFDDFLQTDAAINRGNSGGPMFNMNGEVIGINTAIFSPTGGNIGIGFAVPSALAQPTLDQLKKFGRTHRAWLGVKIQPVSDEIAQSLGLKNTHGALVMDVSPKSPSAIAGLQVGDVILSFDGTPITEMRHLPRAVAESQIGKKSKLEIWRKGAVKTVALTLMEMPEDEAEASAKPAKTPAQKLEEKDESLLGMRVATVTDALRQRFRLTSKANGVLVVDVAQGAAAIKQGLRPGDIITKVQDTAVKTPRDIIAGMDEARKAGRGYALVQVSRGEDTLLLTLPTSK